MVLRLLDQLLIFLQLCLIELWCLLTGVGATQAVALDISKAFNRVWHAGLLFKLTSYGVSAQIFDLISFFLSDTLLRVVLDGKTSQEYWVNAWVPQGSILGPTLFLLYINDLPDDVVCGIAIYADYTTLYSKCDQASNLLQELELASEGESDLPDTLDWGSKWLVDFNNWKTHMVSFDQSGNTCYWCENGWVCSWGKIFFWVVLAKKSPSKDMESFFPTFRFVKISILIENPNHWGLKTAVCPIFVKPV